MKGNKSIGFLLNLVAWIATVVGIAFYLVNCRTDYFYNLGVAPTILGFGAAAAVLELIYLILNYKKQNIRLDILPVLISICLMLALIFFIGSRAMGFAAIITFDQNAANQADLQSALVGIGAFLVSTIVSIVSSFFDVRVQED